MVPSKRLSHDECTQYQVHVVYVHDVRMREKEEKERRKRKLILT